MSVGKMKAQASVEFMILISVLIIIFILYTQNSFSLQKDMTTIKASQEARDLSDKIAFEINTAVKSGDGYKRNFYVDRSFAGIVDFDILVENYEVKIIWYQDSVTSQMVTKNTTGAVDKGWNLIENIDGVIHVS